MEDEVLKSIAKTQATVQVLLTQFLEINCDNDTLKDMIRKNVDDISAKIYQLLRDSQ